ncbi:MAG: helix-turn-helix transcriptional regulator [Aristaeellaceae bacterium]
MNDLGQKIRQTRRDRGLTQEQLAETLHVSRQTISHWENGRTLPDYLLLCELAKILETDVVAFLQELPAGQEAAAAEALPVEPAEEPRPDPAPGRRLSLRRMLLIAAALVALLAGVGAVVCLRTPAEPSIYTAAWFMEQPPAAENTAFLHTYCPESPIRARQRRPDATPMYQFSIYIREENGVGCTMDSVTMVYFCGDRVQVVDVLAQEDFINLGLVTPYLAGNHMRRINMGMPAGEDTGIGIHITATDDNGNTLESRCYLPLENAS